MENTCGKFSNGVVKVKLGDGKSKVTTEKRAGGIGMVWLDPNLVTDVACGDIRENIDDFPDPFCPTKTNFVRKYN